MQVRDLIEELQRFDPRDEVKVEVLSDDDGIYTEPERVLKAGGFVTIICEE